MKKIVLAITITLFSTWAVGVMPSATPAVQAQKRDDRKKEPNPPVERQKRDDSRGKNPPPRKERKP